MDWARIPTNYLNDYSVASLDDRMWRILMEIELLCSQQNGPIRRDVLSWSLRHDCEPAVIELKNRGLLVESHGEIYPKEWMARNGPYLNKLEYNRARHKGTRQTKDDSTGKGLTAAGLEEIVNGTDVQTVIDALEARGADRKLIREVVDRLTGGMPFDDLFPEPSPADRLLPPGTPKWGTEDWRAWANSNQLLYNAPADLQEASYWLYNIVGFEPAGKDWLGAVGDLLETAEGSLEILRESLIAAKPDIGRLTFRGPRSFKSYVRTALARHKIDAARSAPKAVDVDSRGSAKTVEL